MNTIKFTRTDATHTDFISLVALLNAYLHKIDGDEHAFYSQFNQIDMLKYVVLAYQGEQAVGCGAIKEYNDNTMEVKRMYVLPAMRGRGVASFLLDELETWAKELGATHTILETGKRQIEAVALYHKKQYQVIPNYGQYEGVEDSICFLKGLN